MKQGIVKFSKEFVTAIGTKEWVGVEMEYDMSTECPRDVLTNAKTIVEQWHQSSNQGILDNSIPPGPPPVIQVKPEDREIGVTVEHIMSCDDLKTLDTYKFLVRGKQELQQAFWYREEQLKGLGKTLDDNK